MTEELHVLLNNLEVPEEFSRYDQTSEADIIIRLEEWSRNAYKVLTDLRADLETRESLSLQDRSQVIAAVSSFDGQGPWILESSKELAQGILRQYTPPEFSLVENILDKFVKPNFRANPHPALNQETGRKLPRPAGGSLAYQDQFEGQTWKLRPGVINVVSWCVRNTQPSAYEGLWHLIIPPVMTLLDDYETRYKLRGIQVVSELLQTAPPGLLRRTGIDGLLFSSLKLSLTYLHNPETPSLIRAAVPTWLSLIKLTTSPGSASQFEQLCAILGDGIIGSVWLYGTRDIDAIEASLDVLPAVVQALDIGSARYLKAIISQLTYPLLPTPENTTSTHFKVNSLSALQIVIRVCAPRMHKWKGTILSSVAKCWVATIDSGADDDATAELKRALQGVSTCLAQICPSVVLEEYVQLLKMDSQMFEPLLRSQNTQVI